VCFAGIYSWNGSCGEGVSEWGGLYRGRDAIPVYRATRGVDSVTIAIHDEWGRASDDSGEKFLGIERHGLGEVWSIDGAEGSAFVQLVCHLHFADFPISRKCAGFCVVEWF
jgi:hypothetical protein